MGRFKAFLQSSKYFGVLVLLCTALITGCAGTLGDNSASKSESSKTIVVGTDAAYAPFSWRDEGNTLRGIDIDLWKSIAKQQNIDYKLMARNFEQILQYLESGKIDAVIAAVSYSDKRSEIFDFSDPYYRAGSVVVASGYSHINSLEDLKGLRIAVKAQTIGDLWARQFKDQYQLEIKEYNTSTEAFMAVHMGSCDFTIVDAPIAVYTLQSGLYPGLSIVLQNLIKDDNSNNFYLIVKKGEHPEILEKFNAGLKHLQDSGEYEQILSKYLTH